MNNVDATPDSDAVALFTGADPLVGETVERLLSDTCSAEVVEQAERDGWCAGVWEALADGGFPWVSIPEMAGGSGGSLADTAAILRAIGRHAAPVPLAETGLLGGWLFATSGLQLPGGPVTVVPDPTAITLSNGRLIGEATVAWAEQVERVVVLVGADHPASGHSPAAVDPASIVVSVRPEQLTIRPGRNLAGEPRDVVLFDVALSACDHAEGAAGVDADALLRREAFTRIVLAAGALQRLSQMTIDYTHDRRQFSKPVASFQAVQHHLVTVAQCAARASMAADVVTSSMSYYTTIGHGGSSTSDEVGIAIAAARVVVDAAITDGTRSAHQAHGAMGVTREYPLHLLTQRLWAWRHEYGSVTSWRRRLGRAVHEGGADALFPTISGRSESVGAAGPAAEQPCQVPT